MAPGQYLEKFEGNTKMKTVIVLLLTLLSWSANATNPILCNEITNDPDGHGYSSLPGPHEIAAELNTSDIPSGFQECVDRGLLLDQIDLNEWDNQTASEAQKLQFLTLFSGDGCIRPQGFAIHIVKLTFPIVNSPSVAAMRDAARRKVSRAEQLGLNNVSPGNVAGCQ